MRSFWHQFFALLGSLIVKSAHKMLVKLTPGVIFINILWAAIARTYPESAKKTVKLSVFFALLGYLIVKSARKLLVKLSLGFSRCSRGLRSRGFTIFEYQNCQFRSKLGENYVYPSLFAAFHCFLVREQIVCFQEKYSHRINIMNVM